MGLASHAAARGTNLWGGGVKTSLKLPDNIYMLLVTQVSACERISPKIIRNFAKRLHKNSLVLKVAVLNGTKLLAFLGRPNVLGWR